MVGRSRGGRSTKIYALTDRFCLPLTFLLQAADCAAADVVGIFPNETAFIRLIGAVLLEPNDECQPQGRYLQTEPMTECTPPTIDAGSQEITSIAA